MNKNMGLTDRVVRVPSIEERYSYIPQANQELAEFKFNKSPRNIKFGRNYNTIDTYLSYVGGLIGTIIGFMFFLGKYS